MYKPMSSTAIESWVMTHSGGSERLQSTDIILVTCYSLYHVVPLHSIFVPSYNCVALIGST